MSRLWHTDGRTHGHTDSRKVVQYSVGAESAKSQFVCPCHLGTPEPLSKGGIYEIYFSTDSNVKNTNKRDVGIPKKWNLPKAQWHTQDILQTPSCPFPGILQGHFKWPCTGWFFNLFRPKFRAKKKNVVQPRRIFCTSRISWNRFSDWLPIVFHFGTENWGSADVLSGWTFCQEDVLSGPP